MFVFVSSADSDVPGSRHVVHSDEETGPQTAYLVGTNGIEGWRTAWRTESEPTTGEPQVHAQLGLENKLPSILEWPQHLIFLKNTLFLQSVSGVVPDSACSQFLVASLFC